MVEKLTKKVFVLLALLIVLFQSFSLPIYASTNIQPWKGNPWTGDSWTGKSWNGEDFQWEGSPWEGNSWQGNTTQGNDWEGNGTEGKRTEGQGTSGQSTRGQSWEGYDWSNAPWYMDPWINNGWTPNGFQGNGTNGSPFTGNSTNGSPFNGTGTVGNSFNGLGTVGGSFAGNGTIGRSFEGKSTSSTSGEAASSFTGNPADMKLPMGYEVAKYISNDVIGGQVNMMSDFMDFNLAGNPGGFKPNGTFFSSLVLNGVKVGLGDRTPWYVNGAADAQDATLKSIDAAGAIKDYKILRNARNLSGGLGGLRGAENASDLLSGLSKVGSISKLNVATAAIGAGYSAVELGFNGVKAYDVLNSNAAGNEKVSAVSDATSNLGDLIMNAGVVTAAFPGGQAAGAVMIAGGAALWGASKLTKLVADNWSGIKKFAKHPIKNTAKAVSKGIDKIKGWFS